jgi:hypothetical protein
VSEHFCHDCKHSNGDGNTCTYTGAVHTTGIHCPAFELKEESDMSSGLKHTYPEGNEHEPVNAEWVQDGTPIRTFKTGATRDTAQDKLDYVKALSPIVLRRYVQYLDKHRLQPDGSYREFDNWKRGIPQETYRSSHGRHFWDDWLLSEGYETEDNHGPVTDIEEVLCAELFNIQGRLHEILKARFAKVDREGPFPGGA